MRRSIGFASLLAGWIALAAAAAPRVQTAPPAEPPPAPASAPGTAGESTIVKGVTVTAKNLPRAVSQFVGSHAAHTRRIDQIARWTDQAPICVAATGLGSEADDFVIARVQEVAASVGAPVATSKPGKPCAPTIEIIFSNDAQTLALGLFKRNEALLGYHFAREVPRLSKFEPPIKAWYATGTRDYEGQFVVDVDLSPPTAPSPNSPLRASPPILAMPGSRLRTGLSSEFANILVIADQTVNGYEIGSISDYMAMLVLTQPRSLAGCAPLPSILDLMSPNCRDEDKPKTLTPADLAYLRALYAASSTVTVGREENDIRSRMLRELTAAH